MGEIQFTKMHGLGNDFVIIDARDRSFAMTEIAARAIASRRTGVGCDQIIVMERAENSSGADTFMRIHNADGSEAGACGNATRCVARLLMEEDKSHQARIETSGGVLTAEARDDGLVSVNMGTPGLSWRDVPLSHEIDTLHLDLSSGPLSDPVAVSMGNPHCVFFVDDVDIIAMEVLGPHFEHHSFFPERANIGVAQIMDMHSIRLRVWERGAGLTMACGTGACAALVSAHRRGLTERCVEVQLDGGPLSIEWRDDDHVIMTGPTAISFSGVIKTELVL